MQEIARPAFDFLRKINRVHFNNRGWPPLRAPDPQCAVMMAARNVIPKENRLGAQLRLDGHGFVPDDRRLLQNFFHLSDDLVSALRAPLSSDLRFVSAV